MRLMILMLTAFMLPAASTGQQKPASINKISLEYGINLISRQDLLFSPMVYQDASFRNISLLYDHVNETRWHHAELFYGGYDAQWHDDYTYLTGIEEDVQTTSPTFITLVGMRYSYLRKLQGGAGNTWSIGGISDNQIHAVDNVYGAFGTFGYLGQFSLSPMVRRQLVYEKHEWIISGYVPVISWISRSPYALNDDEYIKNNADHNGFKTVFRYIGDGNIQTVNRFLKFNLDVDYSYHLSTAWSLGAAYRVEFLRSTRPKTLSDMRNNINLKISYQF